jgi:glycosyltransferase involved in cell wall biosynthesis
MTPFLLPRRILMTTDAVGGVWHYALELCRGLRDSGVEVLLATLGPRPDADQRADARTLDNVTLHESDYRLEWMDAPWADVERAGEWLRGLENEFAPDVVHLNGYAHGALAWHAPVVMVAHSCVLSWWRAVRGHEAPPEWTRYRQTVRAGLHAASTVIAPTRAMLASLVRNYGALPRSEVIPNGCSPAHFIAVEKEPFILSVGRLWDEAKNIAQLARVAPALAWPVRVAGDLQPPAGTPELAPPENVERLGRCSRPRLMDLFARAAIYAAPARYEPFGLSVLEAALSGCALVLGDCPSLRENWEDAAVFLAPEDTDGWRATLAELTRDRSRRDALGRAARTRASAFTREAMLDSYLAAYGRCLEMRTPHEATLFA